MGQKIHPIGFRVGITKKYQCQWFARFHKYNYAQSILEDRMLRTTLMKIFPELLNPLGKKAQKQDSNSGTGDKDNKLAPKITQIKIERGLIPYEISIQIYTENAELIKSAIDNLKINTDLFCYLQKTRQYLLKLKQQINLGDLGKSPTKEDSALTLSKVPVSEDPTLNQLHSELQSESESETEETANKNFNKKTSQEKNKKTLYKNQGNVVEFTDSSTKSRVGGLLLSKSVTGANTFSAITYKAKIKKEVSNKSKKRFFFKSNVRESSSSYASKLAKQQYKKKRLIQRRLKKRQIIAARYGRLISKGLFVKKIGNSIIRHVMLRKSYIKQKQAKRAGITSLATLTDNQAINTNTVATQKKGRLALLSLSLIDKQRVSSGSFALDKSRVQTSALAKKVGGLPTLLGKLTPAPSLASLENQNQNQNQKEKKSHIKGGLKIAYAGIKKKFLSVFINKVNKSFLKHLKNIMSYWHNDLSFSNVSPSESDSESVSPSDSESVSPSDSESVSPSDSESDSDLKEKVVGKSAIGFAPLGYGQHWSSSRLKQLQYQPISKLTRLVEILEKKSLIAMGKLRKHYLAFGVLSKTQGLGYYQIITFLKSLKKLITKLRQQMYVREKKRATSSISMPNSNGSKTGLFLYGSPKSGLPLKNNSEKSEQPSALANYTYWKTNQTADSDKTRDKQKDITDKVLRRTLNNVENQCRKIKFISYLKNIVKKHREQNIFYYLRTVADARKDLKQYKKFTKTHAKFLFGLDLSKKSSNDLPSLSSNESLRVRALPTLRSTQLEGEQTLALPISSLSGSTELGTINQQEKIRERVTRVLNQTSALNFKNATEKTLQSSFLNQIEKQKNMSLSNINLMPKISIKFYSIKVPKSFECKASIVADSIIDALEKRKAFRKVIKDAKENLMRTAKVKGVKIQVAGRLNGAEIARTEWVRAGRVPLQTLRANIDYISCPAHTIYGIIGIKVWIFKGYSKIN